VRQEKRIAPTDRNPALRLLRLWKTPFCC